MIQVSWSLVFGLQELNYSTDGSTGEGERLQNVNSPRQPSEAATTFLQKIQRLISVYISNLCISVFLHIYANMIMCQS